MSASCTRVPVQAEHLGGFPDALPSHHHSLWTGSYTLYIHRTTHGLDFKPVGGGGRFR